MTTTATTATTAPTPTIQAAAPSAMPTDEAGDIWGGYVYIPASNFSTGTIISTWTIGQFTCTNNGIISPWVGYGGWGDNNIAQLGIDYACDTGSPAYNTWTEAYPANSIYYDQDKANIGDEITATVTNQGNGSFATEISDKQAGWKVSVPMTFSGWTPASGEVIVERVGNTTTLPDFAPIQFTNSSYSENGGAQQPFATAPGLIRAEISTGNQMQTNTSAIVGGSFTMTKL